jgi:hypothetical protein
LSEIKAALQKMQYKKSLGKNRILTEAVKNLKRGHYQLSRNSSSYSGKMASSTLLSGNRLS